ncbi:hypothetical protein [Salmonella phage vB_SenS_SB13]|uniref:Uncharacterized protein n=1 Tax=Salmonella phage vB_SenS_SB13 TaxID=2591135 RepID=A0A5J6TA26_9CAUD|nr:hypothetical protein HWC37_gp173 [Salmonella phage vB_SenS_SB13]QFG07661.1 hypothetical protein [Salmonella phage vB_SenS_SB13]
MSRTYRKQSGNRYWRDGHRSKWNYRINMCARIRFCEVEEFEVLSWDEIDAEIQRGIVNNEKKDGHWWNSISKSVKWHSNKLVRQSNRIELHRVLKDPDNYDYNRDHDLRKKGLWWVYD